ncbi:MAG TPA: tRNA guanosine(34) transglycosylase Tgt [Brevundimonas sp.]|nr:tRNA guanosine(34) transglycosylase Tgt [Brevundimonas sp.]
MPFPFEISAVEGRARTGVLKTARGDIRTPAFMPVGTAATVKAMTVDQVKQTGADILLGNTYHLMLRPGPERMERLGGLHNFMRWDKPILTDSGGFQVMSLSGISKLTEEAVTFSSHIDGSKHVLTPERSIQIQADRLGSDIVMQLDECVAWPAEEKRAREGMELSARWAQRSKNAFGTRDTQALFGIQQGSTYENLRRESSERLQEIGFDGYAIGGLAVGEPEHERNAMLDHMHPILPADRPRYLMGVGRPEDLVEGVARGVDMFDCVMPTRNARNGHYFTSFGTVRIRNARYERDMDTIEPGCGCHACTSGYTRSYLRHLDRCNEMLAPMLGTLHNLYYYEKLMADMRAAIAAGTFEAFRESFYAARGMATPPL